MLNNVGVKLPSMLQICNTGAEGKVGDNSDIIRLSHHFTKKSGSLLCPI